MLINPYLDQEGNKLQISKESWAEEWTDKFGVLIRLCQDRKKNVSPVKSVMG